MPLSIYKSFFQIVNSLVIITKNSPSMLKKIEKEIILLSKQGRNKKRKYRSIAKSESRNGNFKKKKGNTKAKKAMQIMNKRGVSLKEAWRIVNRSRVV